MTQREWSDRGAPSSGARVRHPADAARGADPSLDRRRLGAARKRAVTRSGWRTSTAKNSARRRTVRSPSPSRVPLTRRASLQPSRSTCLRTGRATPGDGGEFTCPEGVTFRTKPEIAIPEIKTLKERGALEGVVLADAAYGNGGEFRAGLQALDLRYALGIQSTTTFFNPDQVPPPGAEPGKNGRPKKLLCLDPADHPARSSQEIARSIPTEAFHPVTWREVSEGRALSGRFARVREVVEAHRHYWREKLPTEEWLLIEWPEGEEQKTTYTLSNLSVEMGLEEMVDLVHLRWRVERDYQDLKQEIGLGHFEGRSWRGFHHHEALSIAAYGLLVAERCALSPRTGKRSRISTYRRCRPGSLPEDLLLRPERHDPTSITTMRRRIIQAIVQRISRCPWCLRPCDIPRANE